MAEDFMLTGQNFSDYRLNARLLGRGTSLPTRYTPDGLFLHTFDKKIYQNIGTLVNPIWTDRVADGGSFINDVVALT